MKKHLIFTVTLMTALFIGTASANAVCPMNNKSMDFPPPPPPPAFDKMHKQFSSAQKAEMEKRRIEMDKRLGITAEQKAQFKAIHEKSKAQIAPKIKQLTEVQYEIAVIEQKEFNKSEFGITSLENVKLSGKTLNELRIEERTLKNEIHAIQKANFEASQSIFTDKQKKELQKMHKEKMAKMKKKHHKGHKGFGKRSPMPPM